MANNNKIPKRVAGEKVTHGGKRKGAGRPKKELTNTVSVRVKIKYIPAIKKAIAAEIKRLDQLNKD